MVFLSVFARELYVFVCFYTYLYVFYMLVYGCMCLYEFTSVSMCVIVSLVLQAYFFRARRVFLVCSCFFVCVWLRLFLCHSVYEFLFVILPALVRACVCLFVCIFVCYCCEFICPYLCIFVRVW